jgi:hypothetical protein
MTNDTSTLSGALLEMKDQLIYELGQKGVTASYDSSTGLLGLIGEISNIQTGGGSCYHIEFTEDSYVAVNNVATVTVYLQENYAPKTSATVTFTGGSSTVTATTDSNGIATANVPVSSATTLTATYSNVSDTCTVTTSSVIYQPALDGTETKKQISGTTTISNGVMSCGASYLTPGWDNTGNWKLTFEAKLTNDQSAVAIYNPNDTQRDKNQIKITGNYHKNITSYTNGSAESSKTTSVPVDTWFAIECVKNGNSLTATWNNNSYTITWTQLTTLNTVCIGLDTWGNCASIRNIKVEAL